MTLRIGKPKEVRRQAADGKTLALDPKAHPFSKRRGMDGAPVSSF